MNCKKCTRVIPDDSKFCPYCSAKQFREKGTRTRGNGQGCIYKSGDKYICQVTLGYYLDENGKMKRRAKAHRFATKTEAKLAVERLKEEGMAELVRQKPKQTITFRALYEQWLPTHQAKKSTINCYKAAWNYFQPLWNIKMEDIDVDDLQDCIDSCGHGRRTQENMRAVVNLVYKYGIPRDNIPKDRNLGPFLKVSGNAPAPRESFTPEQIAAIKAVTERPAAPWGADYVYCLIHLGFRPSEFLALTVDSYDTEAQIITGGAKTEAGKNRRVPVAPKIQALMEKIKLRAKDRLICDPNAKPYTLQYFTENVFYKVLEAAGIANPMVGEGDEARHKYTPHSCRHTFATLMKRVDGAGSDKLRLIGHTSLEMLKYYEDASDDDLRQIVAGF